MKHFLNQDYSTKITALLIVLCKFIMFEQTSKKRATFAFSKKNYTTTNRIVESTTVKNE